jgi:hypothetical protein
MGNQREYRQSGGFSSYLYYQVGESISSSNGVVAKVVAKVNGSPFEGLPTFSNTGSVYLKVDKDGNVIQARIYKNRNPVCDLDWDHSHKNANGQTFEKGVVHVQEFTQNTKGEWKRQSKKARYLSDEEILRYGELLRKLKSDIKFRP